MGISILLMLAIGIGVFGVKANITPIAIALMLAGVLLFSSMGILIGALAKNSDTAAGVSQAVGQPMMFLSGIFWNLETFPEAVQIISKVFPLTYLGAGLRDTMLDGNETSALINLAIVLVLAVAFFIVASKLISWKEK
jgi:ABC-2 type transport system permease protein